MGSCISRCWCSCCTIEVIRRIVLSSNVPCRLSRFKSSSGSFDVSRSGQRYSHCRKSSDVTSVISSLNTPELGHRERITSFTENEISFTSPNCISNSVDSVGDSGPSHRVTSGRKRNFLHLNNGSSCFTQKFWTFTSAFKKSPGRDGRSSEYLHQQSQQCNHGNHFDFNGHNHHETHCQQHNSSPHQHQLCHCEGNSRSSSIVSLCGDSRSPKCHSRNKLYPFKCIYSNNRQTSSVSNSLDPGQLDTVSLAVAPVAMSKGNSGSTAAKSAAVASSGVLHCIGKNNQSNLCHTGHTNEASEFMDSNQATAIAVINVTPMTMTSACTSTTIPTVVSNARTNNNRNNNSNKNNSSGSGNSKQSSRWTSSAMVKGRWINSKSCSSKLTQSSQQVHQHLTHYCSLIRRSLYGSSTESEVALFGLEESCAVGASGSSLPLSDSNNGPSNSTASTAAVAEGPSEADKTQAAHSLPRNTSNSAVDTLPKVTSGHGQYTGGGLFGECVPSSAKTADGKVEEGTVKVQQAKSSREERHEHKVYPSLVRGSKVSHPHHLTSTGSTVVSSSTSTSPSTSCSIASNSLSSRISSRMLSFLRSNGQHHSDDVATDDETTFSSIDSHASGKFLLDASSVSGEKCRGQFHSHAFDTTGPTSASSVSASTCASSVNGETVSSCTSLYGQHSSNSSSIRSRLSSLLMIKGAGTGGGGSSNSGPVSTSSSTIKITPSAWVRKANSVIPFTVSGKLSGTCKGPKDSINLTASAASVNKSASNASLTNHLKLRRSLSKVSDSDSMMEFENLMYDFDIPEPTDVILELQSPPPSSSSSSCYTRANKENLISCTTCSCKCNTNYNEVTHKSHNKQQKHPTESSKLSKLTSCHNLCGTCSQHPPHPPSCCSCVSRDAAVETASSMHKSSWVQFNESAPSSKMNNVSRVTLGPNNNFTSGKVTESLNCRRNGLTEEAEVGQVMGQLFGRVQLTDENSQFKPPESTALDAAGFNGYVEQCMNFRVPCIPIVKSNNSLETIDTPQVSSSSVSSSSATSTVATVATIGNNCNCISSPLNHNHSVTTCFNCKCVNCNNNYHPTTATPTSTSTLTANANYCYNSNEGTNVPLVTPSVSSQHQMHHQEGDLVNTCHNENEYSSSIINCTTSASSGHCCHHGQNCKSSSSFRRKSKTGNGSKSEHRRNSSSSSQLPLMDPLLSQVLEETYILAVSSRNKSNVTCNNISNINVEGDSLSLNNNLHSVDCCTGHPSCNSHLQVTSSPHLNPHHPFQGAKVISKESPSKSSVKSCEDTTTNNTLGCPGGDRSSIASIDGLDLEWDDYDQTNIRPEDEDEDSPEPPHHQEHQQNVTVSAGEEQQQQKQQGDGACEDGNKLNS